MMIVLDFFLSFVKQLLPNLPWTLNKFFLKILTLLIKTRLKWHNKAISQHKWWMLFIECCWQNKFSESVDMDAQIILMKITLLAHPFCHEITENCCCCRSSVKLTLSANFMSHNSHYNFLKVVLFIVERVASPALPVIVKIYNAR